MVFVIFLIYLVPIFGKDLPGSCIYRWWQGESLIIPHFKKNAPVIHTLLFTRHRIRNIAVDEDREASVSGRQIPNRHRCHQTIAVYSPFDRAGMSQGF